MIDYSKLTQLAGGVQEPVADSAAPEKVVDSKKGGKGGKKDVPSKKPKVDMNAIADSLNKKKAARKYAAFRITDSYKSVKAWIKDELEATESTDDAVVAGVKALDEVPAEEAIAAVIEVLGEAIDILQGECPGGECDGDGIAEEGPEGAEVAEPEEVEDSLHVSVTNGAGESVDIDAEGSDSTISAPEAPLPEAPMPEEAPLPEEAPMDEPMLDSKNVKKKVNAKKVKDGFDDMQQHEDETFNQIQDLIKAGKNDEALKLLNENANLLNSIMQPGAAN